MSWIIGYVGKSLSRETRERLPAFGEDRLVESAGRTYYVACGGIEETCLHGTLPGERGRWAVLGSGVLITGETCRLLTASDWRRRLSARRPHLGRLGGGFVALRWSTRRLEAFSDAFGLRTLYWTKEGDGFFLSSRPDWLARLRGGLAVDWPSFGSHWLTYHQLSQRSLVQGLERLPSDGYLELTDVGATVATRPYSPSASEDHVATLLSALERPEDHRTVSLGLSGGIDSRVLLSLDRASNRLSVHVFGPATRRDVEAALRIAESEAVPYSHLHAGPPAGDDLLGMIRSHAVAAQAVSPASSALSLRYFPELRAQGKIVIDGGFGEILRRQFMNRLLRRGRRAVEARDAVTAMQHVSFRRAHVFHADCMREMAFGARRDLAVQLDAVGALKERSAEDRIDVLNARTRLPNFFGYEQARMDGLVQSYMPFAHPRVVDAALAIPVRLRRGSRAARRLIARHWKNLRKYPLVKGDVSYPYFIPPTAGTVLAIVKTWMTDRRPAAERDYVLRGLEEFVLDRIQSVKNLPSSPYDHAALEQVAGDYYANGAGGEQLDWWLALELWREAVERNG